MDLDAYTMDWLDGQVQAPPKDDRDREGIDIYRASIHSIAGVFLALGKAGRLELAGAVLLDERRIGGVERMSYAEFAGGAALVAGEPGIQMLAVVAESGSYKSWSNYAIESLWLAASGKQIPHEGYAAAVSDVRFPVNETVRIHAREVLDEIIVTSKENLSLFSKIMTLASNEANKNQVTGGVNEFAEHVMKVFAAGSITVSTSVLEDFESLVSRDLPEERYQEFLKSAPNVLDPLAAEVIPKHRLGDDYITDFVIRRHDRRYLVVEIEKPQDRIFTARNDFTAEFSHAMGQVLDFQGWVTERADYARSKLPNIENPRGLLVMGRRSALTEYQEKKLRRWCINSNSIEVATFDDLIISGRQLLASMRAYIDSEIVQSG